jgi:uncharacterized membrane protein
MVMLLMTHSPLIALKGVEGILAALIVISLCFDVHKGSTVYHKNKNFKDIAMFIASVAAKLVSLAAVVLFYVVNIFLPQSPAFSISFAIACIIGMGIATSIDYKSHHNDKEGSLKNK